MNKSILLSVKPEHAVHILNGNKTLELRKNIPKDFTGWVYIYVTKNLPPLMFDETNKEEPYFVPIEYNFSKKWKEECEKDYMNLNGLVVGRFWYDTAYEYKLEKDITFGNTIYINFDDLYRLELADVSNIRLLKDSCLSFDEIWNYVKKEKPSRILFSKVMSTEKIVYAWHIKKLEIFDTPMELSKFYVKGKEQPLIVGEKVKYGESIRFYNKGYTYDKLKRPFQSWGYVYVEE